jgi:amidase
MARRVTDLWTAFEVMAGPTWRDPRTVPAPLRGPQLRPPLGVAVVLDPAGGGITPHVQDGVRTAAAVLANAGYAVEETEPPGIAEAAQVALSMLNTPDFRALLPHLELFEAPTRQFLTEFYDAAGDCDPVTTVSSFMTRHALLRQWGEYQQTRPLILAPICTGIPFKVGTDLGGDAVARTIHDMRMAIATNALGLPAMAVPVDVADGLPQVIRSSALATAKTSCSTPPPPSRTPSESSPRSTRADSDPPLEHIPRPTPHDKPWPAPAHAVPHSPPTLTATDQRPDHPFRSGIVR